MPEIYDPAFYSSLVKAFGLRENFRAVLAEMGVLAVVDVGQLLSNPPPFPTLAITPPLLKPGVGIYRVQNPLSPGPGVDWTDGNLSATFIPPARAWRLRAVTFVLVTSAAAGNRRVALLVIGGGAAAQMEWWDPNPQAPSTTVQYNFVPNATAVATVEAGTINHVIPIPNDLLIIPNPATGSAGKTIRSQTLGIAAADQYSNIFYEVEEY